MKNKDSAFTLDGQVAMVVGGTAFRNLQHNFSSRVFINV
jgi:hypothetical protein